MKKKSKIHKKTILKVFREIALGGRSEVKLVARKLRITKSSAQTALELLYKFKLISKRTYKDIGVSYYYPSNNRKYTVIIASKRRIFLILIDSSVEILDYLEFANSDYLLPDENLHYFLKNAHEFITKYSYYDFPSPVYFFNPMKTNEADRKKYEYLFKEYSLIDLHEYISTRLEIKKVRTIPYLCTRTLNINDKDDMCSLMCVLLTKLITKNKNKNNKDDPK